MTTLHRSEGRLLTYDELHAEAEACDLRLLRIVLTDARTNRNARAVRGSFVDCCCSTVQLDYGVAQPGYLFDYYDPV